MSDRVSRSHVFAACWLGFMIALSASAVSAQIDPISCPALSQEYAHVICDLFDDGSLDDFLWARIPNSDPSVRLAENAGQLLIGGLTSSRDAQTGLDTRTPFEADDGFEVVVLVRAIEDEGGRFVIEFHDTSTYYHVTLVCGEKWFGFWYCYFGESGARGCHEAIDSPLEFLKATSQAREARILYDSATQSITVTVSGRLVGRLDLPYPLKTTILRLFTQSPLEPSELGGELNYAIEAATPWMGERLTPLLHLNSLR